MFVPGEKLKKYRGETRGFWLIFPEKKIGINASSFALSHKYSAPWGFCSILFCLYLKCDLELFPYHLLAHIILYFSFFE